MHTIKDTLSVPPCKGRLGKNKANPVKELHGDNLNRDKRLGAWTCAKPKEMSATGKCDDRERDAGHGGGSKRARKHVKP